MQSNMDYVIYVLPKTLYKPSVVFFLGGDITYSISQQLFTGYIILIPAGPAGFNTEVLKHCAVLAKYAGHAGQVRQRALTLPDILSCRVQYLVVMN